MKAGSALKDLNAASDAFILQYYEEPDSVKAAFGKKLTREDWSRLAHIKDVYQDVLFTAPIVAVNVSHPLIQYMYDELRSPDRKFTFLVGHDSNLSAVATALGVEEYELPNAIEKKNSHWFENRCREVCRPRRRGICRHQSGLSERGPAAQHGTAVARQSSHDLSAVAQRAAEKMPTVSTNLPTLPTVLRRLLPPTMPYRADSHCFRDKRGAVSRPFDK